MAAGQITHQRERERCLNSMTQCKSLGGTEQATRKAVKLKSEEKMGFTKSVGRLIWKSPEKKKSLDDCKTTTREVVETEIRRFIT